MTERTLREQIEALQRNTYSCGTVWVRLEEVLRILDAHTAAQPAPAHIAAATCTCGHCGGLVCCQNCGTPPQPAPDAVAEAAWTGPGERPHEYHPDLMAMGDCSICGHVYEAHLPAKELRT